MDFHFPGVVKEDVGVFDVVGGEAEACLRVASGLIDEGDEASALQDLGGIKAIPRSSTLSAKS